MDQIVEGGSDTDTIDQITANNTNKVSASMVILNGNRQVQLQVDTGSARNILPHSLLPMTAELRPVSTMLASWTGNKVKPVGEAAVRMRNTKDGKKYKINFLVVRENLTPILGLRARERMGLVSINREITVNNIVAIAMSDPMITEFADVFEENTIGALPGEQCLTVSQDAQPSVSPPRRYPFAVMDKLKQALESMKQKGAICRVEEPSEWESNLATPQKPNGEIRPCINPSKLNKALERERYFMPTIDDILPMLQNAKVFSVVDLKSG